MSTPKNSFRTVTEDVPFASVGHCQPHEHIFVHRTPAAAANPALCIDDEEKSARELAAYRAAGGSLIVDCQPTGAGRDLFALKRLSKKSDVYIVGVTGYHMPAFYPVDDRVFTEDVSELRERFVRELTEGVSDSGGDTVFPGAVKAAIGKEGAAGRFEVCLRAAAQAAAQAGVPLILHTEYGIGAVDAVMLCEREGLDPAHIAVCHVDRQSQDFKPHDEVARTGAYLEYDTIGRFKYHDDESECALIKHMLDTGRADRLLFSLDTTAGRLGAYGGSLSLTYLLEDFLPRLRACGVEEAILHDITHVNLKNLFA